MPINLPDHKNNGWVLGPVLHKKPLGPWLLRILEFSLVGVYDKPLLYLGLHEGGFVTHLITSLVDGTSTWSHTWQVWITSVMIVWVSYLGQLLKVGLMGSVAGIWVCNATSFHVPPCAIFATSSIHSERKLYMRVSLIHPY